MATQEVCMRLTSKTKESVIYEIGYPDKLDWKIELLLSNPLKYKVINESELSEMDKGRALGKLLRLLKEGEIPEITSHVS